MTPYPTGWFQVGCSADVQTSAIKALRCFGRDLIIRRDGNGKSAVFDAHCPHMGAHLAYGGTVDGTDIVCPYHGWRWGSDGANVNVPYSTRVLKKIRLHQWESCESRGIIWLWYDHNGRGPSTEPPDVDVDRHGGCERVVPSDVRMVAEACVDAPHLRIALGASSCELISLATEAGQLRAVYSITDLPGGTPAAELTLTLFGLGALRVSCPEWRLECLQTQTPIAQGQVLLRSSALATAKPGTTTRRWNDYLLRTSTIWQHLQPAIGDPWMPEERAIAEFRTWAEHFYNPAELSSGFEISESALR